MTDNQTSQIGLRIEVQGQVQGVGFRPWVFTLATEAGIRGRVWNHAEGVTIEAFGDEESLRAFAAKLSSPPAPAASVSTVHCESIPVEEFEVFSVVESRDGGHRSVSIPPDWATCEQCRRELRDPADHRHGYAFINCTHCGPRYTICRDVPYDRAQTTMASFAMCDDCRREYGDPRDRRFHAEPNACPACGPHLTLLDAEGRSLDGDPIARAATALRDDGAIVAIKGLGGFHLACDATAPAAVERLRQRKRRDQKPFAVMLRDMAEAEHTGRLSEAERVLLASGERPIVLVERHAQAAVTPAVAPGNRWLGLMLPYTPLHELLLAAVGRPLVMTSANLSDEPIASDNAEAIRRLATVADVFLMHDREIANRCDDSVARVIDGRPVVIRRSRGYVPARLPLARPVTQPLLACGAHLKNVFCFAAGDSAWLGPHIGDLETDEACRAFEESVERFQRFVGIVPEVVAHDLHPDYFTTRYALARELPRVGVQHHHAHIVACMAEHGLSGPVIGLAWDGTGYGTDGSAWGGELLIATAGDFERLATFRPLRLAGGDRAIRQVWRSALALLDQAFEGDPPIDRLPLFAHIAPREIEQVRRMIATGLNSPAAHGVGRFFDVFGAIALGRTESRYEGQVAVEFAGVADPAEGRAYSFEVESGSIAEIDLRPALREAVADLLAGRSVGTLSGRFHTTLVAVGTEMVRLAEQCAGRLPVVLSGGCCQNALLVERLRQALAPRFEVFSHQRVPPGDGGIGLGQAVIAEAIVRKRTSATFTEA